jgi:hypothetical protein
MPDDISYGNMSDDELYDLALKTTPFNPDGSQSKDKFLKNLASTISVSVEAAQWARALAIFKRHCENGPPREEHSLYLIGMEPWNGDRLVLGPGDGTFMTLEKATPKYTEADAKRSRDHEKKCRESADRKTELSAGHAQWAIVEIGAGRGADLSCGRFVRDTGRLLSSQPPRKGPKPEQPPDSTAGDQKA